MCSNLRKIKKTKSTCILCIGYGVWCMGWIRFYYYFVFELPMHIAHAVHWWIKWDRENEWKKERIIIIYCARHKIHNISIWNATTIMYFLCSTNGVVFVVFVVFVVVNIVDEFSAYIHDHQLARTLAHSHTHVQSAARTTQVSATGIFVLKIA